MTPAQAARDAELEKRQMRLRDAGAMTEAGEFAAIRKFMVIAEDNSKSVDDLLDAIDAHLSELEASMN